MTRKERVNFEKGPKKASNEEIIKQAQELMLKQNKEKQAKFLEEYKALCIKHRMEIVSVPQLSIREINNQ